MDNLMMARSAALFVHIVGIVALFVGLALEWLSLDSLRNSTTPAQGAPWVGVLRGLPRLMAPAVGLILVSGIYLGARVGVLHSGWVDVSLAAMFLMGILGGPVVRSQTRAFRHVSGDDRGGLAALRQHASHPLLRASLRLRVAVALAIIYLMIAKPDLGESLLPIGLALLLGAVVGRRDKRSATAGAIVSGRRVTP
jgi:uncharacterized membrane protein